MNRYKIKSRKKSRVPVRFFTNMLDALAATIRARRPHLFNGVQNQVLRGQRNLKLKKMSQAALFRLALLVPIAGMVAIVFNITADSAVFRVTDVQVSNNQTVTSQQIIALSQLDKDISLLSLDSDATEQRIAAHPWIDHAEIKRDWPTGIVISVHERKPLALVNLAIDAGSKLHYFDDKGRIFAPVNAADDLDFPVITGMISPEERRTMRLGEKTPAGLALDFLQLTAHGNPILPIQSISEININPHRGLIVYLVEQTFPIYLGKDDIRTKYSRLVKILDYLYKKHKVEKVAEIQLDYTENQVLVAMVEPQQ